MEEAKMKTKYLIMACVVAVSLFLFTSAYAQDDDLSLIGNRLDVLAFLKAYLNNPLGLKGPQLITQAATTNILTLQTAVAAPAPQPPPLRMTTVTVDGKKTTTVRDIMDRTYVNGLLTHAKVGVTEQVGGVKCYYTVDTSITYDTQTQTAKVTQITSNADITIVDDTYFLQYVFDFSGMSVEILAGVTLYVGTPEHTPAYPEGGPADPNWHKTHAQLLAASITLDATSTQVAKLVVVGDTALPITDPNQSKVVASWIGADPLGPRPPFKGDLQVEWKAVAFSDSMILKNLEIGISGVAGSAGAAASLYVEAHKLTVAPGGTLILGRNTLSSLSAAQIAQLKLLEAQATQPKGPTVTYTEIPFSSALVGEMPASLVLQGSVSSTLPAGVQMAGTMVSQQNVMDPIKK